MRRSSSLGNASVDLPFEATTYARYHSILRRLKVMHFWQLLDYPPAKVEDMHAASPLTPGDHRRSVLALPCVSLSPAK